MRTARLLSLDTDKVWSWALVAIVSGLVGSRILLILLNWPRYGASALTMSLSGTRGPGPAAIAIAVATGVVYALHLGLPIRRTADAIAPSLALGSSVLSVGCLEAGCDYGTPTHLPWAVVFTNPAAMPGTPLGVPLHPTQIYASLVEFVLFVVLLWLVHRPHRDGEILGAWLFLAGLANFLLDLSARRQRLVAIGPHHGHPVGGGGDGARREGSYGCIARMLLRSPMAPPVDNDEPSLRQLTVPEEADGQRLDLFLAQQLDDVSRSRVQLLLEQGSVLIGGKLAKASRKVRAGENISILGEPQLPPLRAMAEEIPLEIVYEDGDLAVVNKPAGMMVHAGSGATEDARNRGTLVNALLHHMRELSSSSGPLRPGIVHRLDKQTSGLIVVAKNDVAHARLASMFSRRQVRKLYLTLVQGELPQDSGTVNASISRDTIRRTRMTTRREGGRSAVSHWQVLRRIHGPYGSFTLASVRIETGRTHQIRVHMASLGHPVVGDTLYGASTAIVPLAEFARLPRLALQRNFLHAAELEFAHPTSSERITMVSNLPPDLKDFMARLASSPVARSKSVEGMYLDQG